MNCLFCQRILELNLKFYELFLLYSSKAGICEKCLKNFPKISDTHCPRCWKDGEDSLCQDCRDWEEKGILIQHQAFYSYHEAMKEYFSNYKFQGNYQLRFAFSKVIKQIKLLKDEVLVPIPLSNNGLLDRGFNQVTGFLEAENMNYLELLTKPDTIKQSSLTRHERLESKNVFKIIEDIEIPKKVILMDDIYTTGATLVHASQTLKKAGVTDIRTFSLCR